MERLIKLPEWLQIAADDAKINYSDMAKIFGYKNKQSFTSRYALRPNDIPRHNETVEYKTQKGGIAIKHLWKVKDVRDFIKNLEKSDEQNN